MRIGTTTNRSALETASGSGTPVAWDPSEAKAVPRLTGAERECDEVAGVGKGMGTSEGVFARPEK
jgi:hypothetical protein